MKSLINGGAIPALNKSDLSSVLIPLPPLPVQQEIVRILDRFTDYEAELAAELAARKEQYEWYRDELLDFAYEDDVEYVPLSEAFIMRNGYTPSKKNPAFWTDNSIPWYRMEDIRANGRILTDAIQHITPEAVKQSGLFPAGSIIMATTATIGEHALLGTDALANQRFTCFTICDRDRIDPKYAFYYFYLIGEWCRDNVNVSNFPSVDMDKLKAYKFPLPSLATQRRIVSILDRFDTLTNSLTSGLPAEIEAVHRQYEYYRDTLLAFPKA